MYERRFPVILFVRIVLYRLFARLQSVAILSANTYGRSCARGSEKEFHFGKAVKKDFTNEFAEFLTYSFSVRPDGSLEGLSGLAGHDGKMY